MNSILEHYRLNQETMALLPAAESDYQTIVVEQDQRLFVQKTPLQLIQQACLDNYSTYEGRKKAVAHKHGIYTFPTHSPTDSWCYWIVLEHILHIVPSSTVNQATFTSKVMLKNRTQIVVPVSHFVLKKTNVLFICLFTLS